MAVVEVVTAAVPVAAVTAGAAVPVAAVTGGAEPVVEAVAAAAVAAGGD